MRIPGSFRFFGRSELRLRRKACFSCLASKRSFFLAFSADDREVLQGFSWTCALWVHDPK
jgi:hypothetical protein